MNNDGLYPPEEKFRTYPVTFYPACNDPNHLPGITMISLQPGQVYEHVCPSCGSVARITQNHPRLNVQKTVYFMTAETNNPQ